MEIPQRSDVRAGSPTPEGSGARALRWPRRAAVLALLALLAAFAPLLGRPYAARLRETARQVIERALVERVPRARLEGGVHLDARYRVVAGPIVVPARRAGAPPVVRIERVLVRPRFGALLRGRIEPSRVSLEGVHLEPGPGLAELAALVDEIPRRGPAAGAAVVPPASPPVIAFSGVTAALPRPGAAPLVVGPYAGAVTLARAADGAPSGAWRVTLPGGGRVEGAAREGGAGMFPFTIRVAGAWVRSRRLAAEPVGPLAGAASGVVRWDRAARRVALEDGRVLLGEHVSVAIRGAIDMRGEGSFEAALEGSDLDWSALVAALPATLRPPPEAPSVAGTVSARLTVSGPPRRPTAWRLDGDLDVSRLRAAPGGPRLDRPFVYRAALPGGGVRDLEVGPRNPAFVPLAEVPRLVVRAVTTSEDAGFFGHHGFDLDEIRDALAHGNGGARLRGASTISQQVAKNLYLSPERTLARKVREALATVALETCVGKRRLLEIYLNVAEWGDGVFGLGEAARHWFGKDVRALSPKEAAFLASVIPNPVRYEMYRRRGALTPAWEERVHDLLAKLHAAQVLTDEELLEAWDAPLAFARGS
jgi:transglycosylase-like protein